MHDDSLKLKIEAFTIKQASLADFDTALHLLKVAAQRLKDMGQSQWQYWLSPPAERLAWLREGFENNQVFLVDYNHRVIAMFRLMDQDLKYWGNKDDSSYYIHSLIVHPKYKGQQLGIQIIHMIQDWAVKGDKDFLRLDCDASNTDLCNYYKNLGFLPAGKVSTEWSTNQLFQKAIER